MQSLNKVCSEKELVTLLKSRNAEAYNVLYDNYSAALYGIISRVVPAEEIAQDLLQEAFVKIWKNIDTYDSTRGRLFTWMLNIARNSAIDYSRSKQFKMEHKIQEIENSVYEINRHTSTSINIDTIGLREQVEKLKEDHKILINMIYFGGYTQEETARKLKIPLGTVKTRVRAAIIQLRQLIK